MDLDRSSPPDAQDKASREGAGAMWLALLAMLLAVSGIVVIGVPAAALALWLGIRAQRSQGRASGPALTTVVLGLFGMLIGVAGPAVQFALQEFGERQMPELVTEHEARLRPDLLEAAEAVFPCEGRVDGVGLRSLYTQYEVAGGRPALTLDEARVAYVDVTVHGESYTVSMDRSADSGWDVNNRMDLTAASEEAAGQTDPTG
ncbi:hypothetical protein BH23ACT8_BH23ACT8_03140 [soil metagenome]